VARVVRRRRIAAPASALWAVIADPYHMPRWWPNTDRVENVTGLGSPPVSEWRWTQVLTTRDGRGVRADYRCAVVTEQERFTFEQEIEDTPFERFVKSVRTDIELQQVNGETDVTIALDRRLRGLSRFGAWMMRRATKRTLDDALNGLEVIATGGSS
jgi:uncharacterized protein YndB with AHSA1/START domain